MVTATKLQPKTNLGTTGSAGPAGCGKIPYREVPISRTGWVQICHGLAGRMVQYASVARTEGRGKSSDGTAPASRGEWRVEEEESDWQRAKDAAHSRPRNRRASAGAKARVGV